MYDIYVLCIHYIRARLSIYVYEDICKYECFIFLFADNQKKTLNPNNASSLDLVHNMFCIRI